MYYRTNILFVKRERILNRSVDGKGTFGYTNYMPDAQTIYEIRLAIHKPGCAVCTLVQRAGARYIEGAFNESMLDPVIRHKLVASLGFCYEHTWLSINLKLSDALGHAILYLDLIKATMEHVKENEKDGSGKLVSALDAEADCPACLIEQATLERVIDSLVTALRDEDFVREYKQSGGLCFPHLQKLLPYMDSNQQAKILSHQWECMESLKDELAEFIRKSDYRFRDDVIGREGDSYKRAADMVNGKRRPTEKKDLR
jgi:Family of unknown function (DUF6062)